MTARPDKAAEVRRRRKPTRWRFASIWLRVPSVLSRNSSVSGELSGGLFAQSHHEASLLATFPFLNALKEPPLDLRPAILHHKKISRMPIAASRYSDIG